MTQCARESLQDCAPFQAGMVVRRRRSSSSKTDPSEHTLRSTTKVSRLPFKQPYSHWGTRDALALDSVNLENVLFLAYVPPSPGHTEEGMSEPCAGGSEGPVARPRLSKQLPGSPRAGCRNAAFLYHQLFDAVQGFASGRHLSGKQ